MAFTSSVCEEVCGEKNLFEDGQSIMGSYSAEEVKEMAKHAEKVELMEERVKAWIKRLDEILKESEQIRRENDSSGTVYISYSFNFMYDR